MVGENSPDIESAESLEELAELMGFHESGEMRTLRMEFVAAVQSGILSREKYEAYEDLAQILIASDRSAQTQIALSLMQAVMFGSGEYYESNIEAALSQARGEGYADIERKIRSLTA